MFPLTRILCLAAAGALVALTASIPARAGTCLKPCDQRSLTSSLLRNAKR